MYVRKYTREKIDEMNREGIEEAVIGGARKSDPGGSKDQSESSEEFDIDQEDIEFDYTRNEPGNGKKQEAAKGGGFRDYSIDDKTLESMKPVYKTHDQKMFRSKGFFIPSSKDGSSISKIQPSGLQESEKNNLNSLSKGLSSNYEEEYTRSDCEVYVPLRTPVYYRQEMTEDIENIDEYMYNLSKHMGDNQQELDDNYKADIGLILNKSCNVHSLKMWNDEEQEESLGTPILKANMSDGGGFFRKVSVGARSDEFSCEINFPGNDFPDVGDLPYSSTVKLEVLETHMQEKKPRICLKLLTRIGDYQGFSTQEQFIKSKRAPNSINYSYNHIPEQDSSRSQSHDEKYIKMENDNDKKTMRKSIKDSKRTNPDGLTLQKNPSDYILLNTTKSGSALLKKSMLPPPSAGDINTSMSYMSKAATTRNPPKNSGGKSSRNKNQTMKSSNNLAKVLGIASKKTIKNQNESYTESKELDFKSRDCSPGLKTRFENGTMNNSMQDNIEYTGSPGVERVERKRYGEKNTKTTARSTMVQKEVIITHPPNRPCFNRDLDNLKEEIEVQTIREYTSEMTGTDLYRNIKKYFYLEKLDPYLAPDYIEWVSTKIRIKVQFFDQGEERKVVINVRKGNEDSEKLIANLLGEINDFITNDR